MLLLGGCSPLAGRERPPERLAACPAPGGRAVATLVSYSGGGAAGWEYNEVRVHRPGASPDSGAVAFATPSEDDVRLHAYWTGPAELVVEYPAVATVGRLEGELRLGADTVWVVPRPVRGMQLDRSDVASCTPYRPGGPLAPPARPGAA